MDCSIMNEAETKFKTMFVSTEETKAIWILTINNPPLNIITPVFFAEFEVVLKQYFQDREAKILIITGAGDRAFSMGADITEIASIDNAAQGRVLAKRGQDLYDQVENSDKPIIAAINSMCFGGANELILACHLRIASEKSKFAQSEINLGLIPGWGRAPTDGEPLRHAIHAASAGKDDILQGAQ